jgi:hypothetical protein
MAPLTGPARIPVVLYLRESSEMEYRFLGASGFKLPVLGLGTGTFGGKGQAGATR